MTNASDIAAEIGNALAEASAAVGDGVLYVTLIKPGALTGDYPHQTRRPDALYTFRGVVGSYSDRDRDGTAIRAGDVRVRLEATGRNIVDDIATVEPETSDKLRVKGRTYSIVTVTPMMPGGEVLGWLVQARGA